VTTRDLVERFGLPGDAGPRLDALVDALLREPDPHTTITDRSDVLARHLADSLVALELTEVRDARAIADIGAGAGFPGLPLAIALPAARVDLVESARRKCAVIERLAAAARLDTVRAVASRAEEWAAGEGREDYDVVTARAVGSLAVLVEYAAPLLSHGGVLVAWKGARDAPEEDGGSRAAALVGLELAELLPVSPFPGARERHLHVYRKVKPTPDRVPRRPGMAAKRPLG
jgi:16S rRNA (guanine527-N7)-methyltransferase